MSAFVALTPRPSGQGKLVVCEGFEPVPLQAVRPLSRLYKGHPLTRAADRKVVAGLGFEPRTFAL